MLFVKLLATGERAPAASKDGTCTGAKAPTLDVASWVLLPATL